MGSYYMVVGGNVQARSEADGSVLWSTYVDGAGKSTPAVDGERVFVSYKGWRCARCSKGPGAQTT